MVYKIIWHERALDDLSGLDKQVAERIISKLDTHLVTSPETLGAPLKGRFKGFYKYRVGDWRAIYHLDRTEKLIKVLKIGHRRDVYT